MQWRGWLTLGLGLVACDPLVPMASDTESAPQGTSTSGDPSPPPVGSDTSPGPSTITDGPSVPPSTSTSSAPDDSSSDGWASSSETGASFLGPTDTSPDDACDPYLQDCPDGEKCNAFANDGGGAWNALGCFPVLGFGQTGDACEVSGSGTSGHDTCDVGLICLGADTNTGLGTCISMCEGTAADPSCADPEAQCIISNEDTLNLCLPRCNPLAPDCPADQYCQPIDDAFVCFPSSQTAGEGGPGDPCTSINACIDGTACVHPGAYGASCAGDSWCCTPYCEVGGPEVCPESEQSCIPWFDEGTAPAGLETLGVCSVPT